FIYMVYYIDRLSYVEPSLHLWDTTYLIMVNNVFDVFLESICQYFIEYFCINVHEGDCLIISWHLFLLGELLLLILELSGCDSHRKHQWEWYFQHKMEEPPTTLVDLSIGWNLPSSAFCNPVFVDRTGTLPSQKPEVLSLLVPGSWILEVDQVENSIGLHLISSRHCTLSLKMKTCGLLPGWYGLTSKDLLTALQMFQNPDQLQDNWLKDEASQTAPVKIEQSS
ncbi:hypothetical protein STEG23_012562, partial [Scotinomys teguina]